MKTNKINVVLSLNKQTVTKLGDQNDIAGIKTTTPGTLTSWVNHAVLHSGNCRVKVGPDARSVAAIAGNLGC